MSVEPEDVERPPALCRMAGDAGNRADGERMIAAKEDREAVFCHLEGHVGQCPGPACDGCEIAGISLWQRLCFGADWHEVAVILQR